MRVSRRRNGAVLFLPSAGVKSRTLTGLQSSQQEAVQRTRGSRHVGGVRVARVILRAGSSVFEADAPAGRARALAPSKPSAPAPSARLASLSACRAGLSGVWGPGRALAGRQRRQRRRATRAARIPVPAQTRIDIRSLPSFWPYLVH